MSKIFSAVALIVVGTGINFCIIKAVNHGFDKLEDRIAR